MLKSIVVLLHFNPEWSPHAACWAERKQTILFFLMEKKKQMTVKVFLHVNGVFVNSTWEVLLREYATPLPQAVWPAAWLKTASCSCWNPLYPPPMMGCCESLGSVSFGWGSGRGGQRLPRLLPPAPFWRSGLQCCHCTTWPSLPGRTAPAGHLSTPADPQSLCLGSPVEQRPPAAGMSHPTGPSAQQTPGPAYSETGRHIWVPWLHWQRGGCHEMWKNDITILQM